MDSSEGKVVYDFWLVEEDGTGVAIVAVVRAYAGEVEGSSVGQVRIVNALS